MEFYQITPSHAQAIKLKEMSQNKTLTEEKMEMLLDEEKPNQTPKLKVSMNRLNSVQKKLTFTTILLYVSFIKRINKCKKTVA